MKRVTIDHEAGTVKVASAEGEQTFAMSEPAAFEAVSRSWLRAGWDAKYVYSFTWMGRPLIQLPDDMMRVQEAIYRVKPTLLIETGVAHGGSLVFYASLFAAMGLPSRVIGIDIEIRPHNRAALENHEMFSRIELIEGSSTAEDVVATVRERVRPDDRVMVVLDSNHSRAHVRAELEAYGPLVTPGSYIVATDGIMGDLVGAPRAQPDWATNNPRVAADEFLAGHAEFVREPDRFDFNEGVVREHVTYWPGAWLRRVG